MAATTWSQLGNLVTERQQYAEATVSHIRALLLRISLQVPQVANNLRALVALRGQMGEGVFADAARTVLDNAQLTEILAALDSIPGEPDAE